MRTLAHALVQQRFVDRGETTRIVVMPLPDSGLPNHLIKAGQPVPLDLLAGKPVHLELDDIELGADLCFQGPPIRCTFPWESVIAVQDKSGTLIQTLVVTVATVMEDKSIQPSSRDRLESLLPNAVSFESIDGGTERPHISVLDGSGAKSSETQPRKKPKLELIDGSRGLKKKRSGEPPKTN